MPNRSLQAKADRAARQRQAIGQEIALREFNYGAQRHVIIDDSALIAAYLAEHKHIRHIPTGKRPAPLPGKGGAIAAKRCYGDGTRLLGPKVVWATDTTPRLIPAKR